MIPKWEEGQWASGHFLHRRNADLLTMQWEGFKGEGGNVGETQEGTETYRESLGQVGMVALAFSPILGRQRQEDLC